MAVILDIDHEDGTTNEYTSTSGGADLTVSEAAALAGTGYGLDVLIDDATADYGQVTGINDASGALRVRFYFDINSLTMTSGDAFSLCTGYNTAAENIYTIVLTRTDAVGYYLNYLIYKDDTTNTASGNIVITDEPHYIEFYLVRSDGSNNGSLQFWLDGVEKTALTGKDNDTRFAQINMFRIGDVSGRDAGTTGTLFIDEIIANNDGSEIGPLSATLQISITPDSVSAVGVRIY